MKGLPSQPGSSADQIAFQVDARGRPGFPGVIRRARRKHARAIISSFLRDSGMHQGRLFIAMLFLLFGLSFSASAREVVPFLLRRHSRFCVARQFYIRPQPFPFVNLRGRDRLNGGLIQRGGRQIGLGNPPIFAMKPPDTRTAIRKLLPGLPRI
jgi:hypothetical protein